MLISNRRLTESIIEALDRLAQRDDLPRDARYELDVAAAGLKHMRHFENGAEQEMRRSASKMFAALEVMKQNPAFAPNARAAAIVDGLIAEARAFAAAEDGSDRKDAFIALQNALDQGLGQLVREMPAAGELLAHVADPLLEQHNGIAMFAATEPATIEELSPGERLTADNLSAYLRDKLDGAAVRVSDVVTLPGGFGKETTLFSARGETFNADLVMRRDTPIDLFGKLDCHVASREFPVLRAVYAHGVPVPEPLWCELSPRQIGGPAYSIVRRVPGVVLGDATGGSGKISAQLQATLARILATLHALPPLVELSAIPAYDARHYAMNCGERTRAYIAEWYEHYLDSARVPMPVLHGLFNWLLAHVPKYGAPTTLVHGDIGFHNLLFHEGRLTGVLDWEFSHVGDPAEDIGYVRNMMGHQIDWPFFIEEYRKAGRPLPGEDRILFYEIWSHVRNAAATVILGESFEAGRLRHVKYGMMFHRFVPHFIAQAEKLIAQWNAPASSMQAGVS